MKDKLRKDCKAHVVCKHDDETYLSPRDTAILDLFSMQGTVSAKEYEIGIESRSPVSFTLTAALDAVATTFTVVGDGTLYLQANDYIKQGAELMVVKSVTANGTDFDIEVYARGHGESTAVAHPVTEEVMKIGRVEQFCEASGDCEIFVYEGKIINAVQEHKFCISWCDKELCELVKEDPDCDPSRVIGNYKDEADVKSRAKAIRELNKTALFGEFQSWDNADGTAGSTRGLLPTARGIKTSTGNTISAIKFDAADVADNACFDAADPTTCELSYALLEKLFNKIYLAEGNVTHVVLNPQDQLALKDFIKPCQEAPCGSTGGDASFLNVDVITGTPFGNIIVVPFNAMPSGQMLFLNRANMKMFAHCYTRGNMFTNKEFEITNGSGRWKNETTANFAFDATQNMCSDMALLCNYKLPTC